MNFSITRIDISVFCPLGCVAFSQSGQTCVTATLISTRMVLLIAEFPESFILTWTSEVCRRTKVQMSLHIRNYRYRYTTCCDTVIVCDETPFSWEPGENCIDNVAIAWVAMLNLSLCMVRRHREGPSRWSPTPKRRANGRSRACYRVEYERRLLCRQWNPLLVRYYETLTFLPLSRYRTSYGSDKLLQIYTRYFKGGIFARGEKVEVN